jgi:hypothetical protein
VKFRSEKSPLLQLVCHCTDCQTALGEAHANAAFFEATSCEVSGELTKRAFTASSGSATTRESCAACGAVMFDRSEGFPTLLGVMAERIAPPFTFAPACHVWTRSRAADAVLPDDLPHHPGNITR